MASGSPTREREEERRLSIRTLVIASVASATAAILTSQFWTAGTPLAAAITPVIVALVSELLHRPTEKLAERLTVEGTSILPQAAGAGPPPEPDADRLPERAPAEPGSEDEPASDTGKERPEPGRPSTGEGPVRVYRPGPQTRRRIAVGVVATTAVLAFAIAAAALTLPELIAGQSVGKRDRNTTLFGGRQKEAQEQAPAPTVTETVPQDEKQGQRTEPEQPKGGAPPGGKREQTDTAPTETTTTPRAPDRR
jgi:hypothetical protein